MDVLDQIKCKKLIFIDACKSGKAKGVDNPVEKSLVDNILKILDESPGTTTLSSSSRDQFSYEHNELKNGIFTSAIKEALTDRSQKVDSNKDSIITLEELFQFLEDRVPQLLYDLYKDPQKKQTPTIPHMELSKDFPVYYINK